jgi:predicted transcriptional regulator
MLEPILGNISKERVLLYLNTRGKGYAREIARCFNTSVTPIQKQLEALEQQNVIVCESQGRTLLYAFNPQYAFIKELQALLDKALTFYPPEEQETLLMNRRRPRRKGKPLTL